LTEVFLGRETSTAYAGWRAISRARKRIARGIYFHSLPPIRGKPYLGAMLKSIKDTEEK
jgi:hypothetical protein